MFASSNCQFYSSVINIDFEVLTAQLYSTSSDSDLSQRALIALFAGIAFFGILSAWLYRRHRASGLAAIDKAL